MSAEKHFKLIFMRGTVTRRNNRWHITGTDRYIPIHSEDLHYGGKPLIEGMEVEFTTEDVTNRELRDFAGSFRITTENVARLIQPKLK